MGAKHLKGMTEGIKAWAVLQPSAVASRFEAMHATRLTDLVGREEEIGLLLRRWARAKSGEGQVVLLSGEPGIGKSRLTAALLEHIGREPYTRLRYFCSPHHADSALYPIIGHFERVARLAYSDSLQTKLDKLDRVCAQTAASKEDAALYAEMLSLPNDGRYPALQLTPEQRRQRTLETLWAQVEVLARQNPVLMVFEIFPLERSDEFGSTQPGREPDRVTSHLADYHLQAGIRSAMDWSPACDGADAQPAGGARSQRDDRPRRRQQTAACERASRHHRTHGRRPALRRRNNQCGAGGRKRRQACHCRNSITATEVPASLHASLMARLDRLGPAKEVGADWSCDRTGVLARAAVGSGAEAGRAARFGGRGSTRGRLGVSPGHAARRDLFVQARFGAGRSSRHALREPRRALHARIVATLESQFTDIVERQPEVMARHCTEAGLIERAAHLWGKAGQRSLNRSALIEAVEQLSRALAQIATLPSNVALRREQISLQVALINPLMHVKGYAAPETKEAAEQARRLIEQAVTANRPMSRCCCFPFFMDSGSRTMWRSMGT